MVTFLQVLIMSVVQGITEWFPLSSQGHIIFLNSVFGIQKIPFAAFLNLAGIFAALIVFWKDIVKLFDFREKGNLKFWGLFLVTLIPYFVVGYFFGDWLLGFFSNPFYWGIMFMISGVIVYSTKFARHKREKFNLFDSIVIGVSQAIALLPGISRTGTTASAGMHLGLKKEEAVRFSFLLAIPILLVTSIIQARNVVLTQINALWLIVSFVVVFIVSGFSIELVMRITEKGKFHWLGIYNFLVGLLLFLFGLKGILN